MLQLFRIPNLFIVAITQYALQYLVLIPALHEANLPPLLDPFHFFLLVFTTVLIAAGGYLINDIIDFKMDLINKPEKVIIGKKLSKKAGKNIYWLLNFIGAFIAIYLASHVQYLLLFLIYPAAILILYFYSAYFKKVPLWGNIIVSLFCAGVAGIILFAERESYNHLFISQPELANKITYLFSGYILFAFFSTLLREIIKDMEDIEGDKKLGLNTFPIVFGIKRTKQTSAIIASAIILGLLLSCKWLATQKEWAALIFTLLAICLPLLIILNYLIKSELKKHFSKLSHLTKMVMLAGLFLLIIIWKF
jgi:4-hydroxybenzoate polyprenyltransferase